MVGEKVGEWPALNEARSVVQFHEGMWWRAVRVGLRKLGIGILGMGVVVGMVGVSCGELSWGS